MGANRREREREQAAERNAAARARKVISKAERSAGRSGRRRRILIRDTVLALAIACALVGAWELVDWLASIGTSNPDARVVTGLIEK